MRIGVVGAGYVGLVTGACLADMGNTVICLDKDSKKISRLQDSVIPFYEPGLEEIVRYNQNENRLSFVDSMEQMVKQSEVIFLAVGTPPQADGSVDLSMIKQAARDIARAMTSYKVIVTKSTVPVGTGNEIKKVIEKNQTKSIAFDVVSNPEFLREGSAVRDFFNPDRVVLGFLGPSSKAKEAMLQIYRALTHSEKPLLITDIRTAELIKYASNTFLATKISFINEIANLCERVGANVEEVARGMGLDTRIGPRFLQAGIGYGGSCFPKDVKGLIKAGEKEGVTLTIIEAADRANQHQRELFLEKIASLWPRSEKPVVAIWGTAFKSDTDDIREAPSLFLASQLLKKYPQTSLRAYDPAASDNFKAHFPSVEIAADPYEAVKDASLLIILTEWDEFRLPDFQKVKKLMKSPIIVDGRNLYEPEEMAKRGFRYLSVGRKEHRVEA